MKEKEIKEPKKKGYNPNDLGVDKSNTQPEEGSPPREKSFFPPISELMQKITPVKDKPSLPDVENKSIKEDKVREEQEVIKRMEVMLARVPEGNRKNKMIELKKKMEVETKTTAMFEKNRKNLEEIVKDDDEYKNLLARKETGEDVEMLIKQNRDYAEILNKKDKENVEESKKWAQSEEGRIWFKEAEELQRSKQEVNDDELQRKIQTWKKLEMMSGKAKGSLQNFMKNHLEYKNLLKREKTGEDIKELVRQNRIYAEEIRTIFIKTQIEADKWLRMNPDFFKDPMHKLSFLMAFGFKSKKQLKKEKKKRKNQKCPNCRSIMDYLEYLDAFQCPTCKKKFYLGEKKLTIIGEI